MADTDLKVLGICGSLRKKSFNMAALRHAVKTAGGIWRPRHRLWELTREAVRVLGLEGRMVEPSREA